MIKHITCILLITILSIMSCHKKKQNNIIISQLDKKIDSMRVLYNFPAVAYGVIRNDSILAINALGIRDIISKTPVLENDYFHIGSCTKSFTAFLSGKLVEKGLISWETKFFDLYPELKLQSHKAYYHINLKQLLSHNAGLISFKEDNEVFSIIKEYEKKIQEGLPIEKRRYYCVSHILKMNPQEPGLSKSNLYSNAGYMAAGLMLEKVTNKSWESLIIELSEELNLDIHIGWPIEHDQNQPKGHVNPKKWLLDSEQKLLPIPQISMNYHPVKEFYLLTAPGGNISITLKGFLRYAQLNLEGLRGKDNYLKASTYNVIFKSYPEYSLGWWVEENDKIKHYAHRGSNGAFYGFICVRPKSNLGIVVMINTHKETGLSDIIQLLEKNFAI